MKNYLGIAAIAAIAGALSAGAIQSLSLAVADQSERVPPTAGIFTGVQYSQKLGDAFRSVSTANKGDTAPANVGGSAVDGLEWIDDSGSLWLKKRYVNGGWATEAAFDPSNSSYIGLVGGGLATIASSSTTDLGSVPQANVSITGTTTIAGFGSSAPEGAIKLIRFAGVLSLTNSGSLLVPGGFDLKTEANDRAIVTHLGAGVWEVTQFTRANGIPVDVSAVGKQDFSFTASVPALHVAAYGQALSRASYPAYLAKVTRAQTGTRTNANATITGIADTSGFAAGMPVEGTGIGSSCTIATFVANTSITLNSSACVTSSGSSTVTVFLTGYGAGGSSSTVGVADCRGRAIAGRDRSDPGALANRLTSSYFGADAAGMNVAGGVESVTMALANLIQHNHAVYLNDPGHSHQSRSTVANYANGGTTFWRFHTGDSPMSGLIESTTTGITVRDTAGGGGTANQTAMTGSATPTPMRSVQPTLIAECVVRVTP